MTNQILYVLETIRISQRILKIYLITVTHRVSWLSSFSCFNPPAIENLQFRFPRSLRFLKVESQRVRL